mmetsp:Transcript_121114/g.376510  ORF Transcript_121114/g.376510 Transcript_121114/m.376510 type:complete len:182 (+) Transcript_121114:1431-1976(+)
MSGKSRAWMGSTSASATSTVPAPRLLPGVLNASGTRASLPLAPAPGPVPPELRGRDERAACEDRAVSVAGEALATLAAALSSSSGSQAEGAAAGPDGVAASPEAPAVKLKGKYKKVIDGVAFESYGAHADTYPCCYLTAACALGAERKEMEAFLERLEHALQDYRNGAGRKGGKEQSPKGK